MKLPLGVWFERARNRYRVRIYKGTRPYYLAYHDVKQAAIDDAQRVRNELDLVTGPQPMHTVKDQLDALRQQYIKD
jgi:hypothetical protein